MDDARTEVRSQVSGMLFGHVMGRMVSAAVALGVPDALGERTRHAEEVAAELDCHPGSLRRLLRSLVALGMTDEPVAGSYALTEAGRHLRSDAEYSAFPFARMAGSPELWAAWSGVEEAVRTGRDAFGAVNGTGLLEHLRKEPGLGRAFAEASEVSAAQVAPAVVEAVGFGGDRQVTVCGAGAAALVSSVLAAEPGPKGVLHVPPETAADAEAALRKAGVHDRCEVNTGSVSESVPRTDGTVLAMNLLNDHTDEEAVTILRNVRDALEPNGGRLVAIAPLLPGRATADDAVALIGDFEMLVTTGGRERSAQEYEGLLAASGLRSEKVEPLVGTPNYSVLRAVVA